MKFIPNYETKVEFLISTKAVLLTEKVSKRITELELDKTAEGENANYDIDVVPFMSYAGEKGYMIGCMIKYKHTCCIPDVGIDFGAGMGFEKP